MSGGELLASQVAAAIRSVVGSGPKALHEPTFAGNEWEYLKECLASTFVSSVGKFVDRFEYDLAQYTGAKYAVATVNGTAALHIALKLAGVIQNDEVLIPALTFVATANAVAYCNAVPHFVDSEESTLGIDVAKLRRYLVDITRIVDGQCVNTLTGGIIRAVVPMHTFGHPVDIDGLIDLASEFKLVLLEDAAESLGSTYKGKHTGTFGKLGVLSFNGNKTITTGGGGAILTNDPELARRAKHLTTTAKLPHAWEYRHDEVGYNYRMPNINAALGCAQLEQLPQLLKSKRDLFLRYQGAFNKVNGVQLVSELNWCSSNYWLQTIILDADNSRHRDVVLEVTNDAGFMTRPAWVLMDELTQFSKMPSMDLNGARSLYERVINIPSSAYLGQDDQ
jgi:aminotransferase in exopolysaccharide biosynthesis